MSYTYLTLAEGIKFMMVFWAEPQWGAPDQGSADDIFYFRD